MQHRFFPSNGFICTGISWWAFMAWLQVSYFSFVATNVSNIARVSPSRFSLSFLHCTTFIRHSKYPGMLLGKVYQHFKCGTWCLDSCKSLLGSPTFLFEPSTIINPNLHVGCVASTCWSRLDIDLWCLFLKLLHNISSFNDNCGLTRHKIHQHIDLSDLPDLSECWSSYR